LLEARDVNNELGGVIAAMSIEQSPDLHGAVVVNVPIPDPAFFQTPAVLAWLANLGVRALDGAFLVEGGAAYNVAFPGETIGAGAVARNMGRGDANLHLDLQVTSPDRKVFWNPTADWQMGSGKNEKLDAPLLIPGRCDRSVDRDYHPAPRWESHRSTSPPDTHMARESIAAVSDRARWSFLPRRQTFLYRRN